jgi:hypothetical protein
MLMTLAEASEIAAFPSKNLIDDRVLIRRETGGPDIITRPAIGRPALDIDDAAALILYAEMRRAGQPVKFAGVFASRIRAAMRDYPDTDQLVSVTLENGNSFALPAEMLDLTTGYTSGQYLLTATLVDCRNLRARVQRAVEAYEPGIEAEHEAA